MLRKISLCAAILVLAAVSAPADETSKLLLARAWPEDPHTRLADLGRGVGIVFTPDLSVPGNCRFYEALGFGCFQDADWNRVLGDIRTWNIFHADRPIRTLILETHGTNGNGLKLQTSYAPEADRSYIAVGALQERLEPDGIEYIVISACNSGRLLRPAIYNTIDRSNGDPLFLPATLGIVDASPDYDPSKSSVTVITPAKSHIETSLIASVSELAPVTRRLIAQSATRRGIKAPQPFAISDMLMEIVLRHPSLALSTTGYVDEYSGEVRPADVSESLFRSLKSRLNALAARQEPRITTASAKKTPAKKSASSKRIARRTAPAKPPAVAAGGSQ